MDKKLVCPCGLTCCDCLFYKTEIYETAKRLRELIKEHELDKFLNILSKRNSWEVIGEHFELSKELSWDKLGRHFDKFKEIPVFMEVLDSIIAIQCKTTCQEVGGCSIGGYTHECSALICLKSKGYKGCWECTEFENCEKLTLLRHNYGYVVEENLHTIKEKGLEAVKSHGNKYYQWQRKER